MQMEKKKDKLKLAKFRNNKRTSNRKVGITTGIKKHRTGWIGIQFDKFLYRDRQGQTRFTGQPTKSGGIKKNKTV